MIIAGLIRLICMRILLRPILQERAQIEVISYVRSLEGTLRSSQYSFVLFYMYIVMFSSSFFDKSIDSRLTSYYCLGFDALVGKIQRGPILLRNRSFLALA